MKCPIHSARELKSTNTMYGIRYDCPVPNCTVACWGGSTSTPATLETRAARTRAHEVFDRLWRLGIFTRKIAYSKLAEFMNLPVIETHIGHFDTEQCNQVIDFSEGILK